MIYQESTKNNLTNTGKFPGFEGMSDTRAKLKSPALYAGGWREDLIRREETAGVVKIAEERLPSVTIKNGYLFVFYCGFPDLMDSLSNHHNYVQDKRPG